MKMLIAFGIYAAIVIAAILVLSSTNAIIISVCAMIPFVFVAALLYIDE